jgi:predicted nucleic acid-binding protein
MGEVEVTLVDASSWIEFLRGRESEPGQRVKALLARGQAAWCDLTLVELWNGARGAAEKAALKTLEQEIKRMAIDARVWALSCELARRCRDKGVTAPTTDVVIAACAVENEVEIEHCDDHFDKILPVALSL